MKQFLLLVISIFTIHTSFAQTAADYFLPLCTGNYLKFDTPGVPNGWEGRTTYYSIIQVDTINGEAFYLHKGYEVMDYDGSTNVFQCFWLRKDPTGNILMGAYDLTSSGSIDSAQVFTPASSFFTSDFLRLNYSRNYIMGPSQSGTDTVISVTATVGTYTNCIQVRSMRKQNGIIAMMEDTYYAKNIGMVKIERLSPAEEVHVANLVDVMAVNCYFTGISASVPGKNKLIIFPNPASDMISLNTGRINTAGLNLNIYNVIGKRVLTGIVNQNQMQINTSDLNNGIYILEIRSGDWKERQKLVIKR
jgi:hypothetical protein